jgi:hypothetical protein
MQMNAKKKHQGIHLDVERLNIWEASEDAGNHLGIIADIESHLHSQDSHTWYHGSWAHLCPSLQSQSHCTQFKD